MKVKVLVLILAVVAITSCKKNGDLAPVHLYSNLNLVNAVAGTDSLNFYQNGTRIYNTSSISPGSQTGYQSVPYGLQTYEVKISRGVNYIINNYQLNLDTAKYYTLFAAGETVDKLFTITDVKPAFTGTTSLYNAQVRYVNASPSTVNLTVTVRDSLAFTNSAFKYSSGYNFTGIGVSNIKVYQAGSATPVFTTTATLAANTYYTLVTKGTLTGTGANQLSVLLLAY